MIQKVLPMYLNRNVTYVYKPYRPFFWFVFFGQAKKMNINKNHPFAYIIKK